jgi:hypothetical protein
LAKANATELKGPDRPKAVRRPAEKRRKEGSRPNNHAKSAVPYCLLFSHLSTCMTDDCGPVVAVCAERIAVASQKKNTLILIIAWEISGIIPVIPLEKDRL